MKKAVVTFFKVTIFFMGWAVLAGLIDIPSRNSAVWRFFSELIPLLVMIMFTILFLSVEKGNVTLPIKRNMGKGTAVGFFVGLVWIGASAAILLAGNQLTIVGKNKVDWLWLWIVSAFINVVMQELLVRGYLYQLVRAKYNLPLAVIFTAVLFTVMHGGALEAGIIPTINVITMYLFTTALYESQETLFAPIMAHAVWNITGAIVLGVVGLADDYPSLYTVAASENTLLSGGNYKIEASMVVTIMNIAFLLVFSFVYGRNLCSSKI